MNRMHKIALACAFVAAELLLGMLVVQLWRDGVSWISLDVALFGIALAFFLAGSWKGL